MHSARLCAGREHRLAETRMNAGAVRHWQLMRATHNGKRLSDALPTLVKRTDAGGVR
jgi:hypothetical protein